MVEVIENIKKERRIKKDEKKKLEKNYKEKLMHEANKFIGLKNFFLNNKIKLF
jgi:hypothetical protein